MTPETHPPAYQRILDMIRANVGDPQPVLLPAHALWVTVGHSTVTKTEAVRAVQQARDNDAVFRWRDSTGTWRYGLTDDGLDAVTASTSLYGPADRDRFERVIQTEVSRDDPDQDVIGWCNRRLRDIDGE